MQKIVGDNIRGYRRKKRWTQITLGERSGVTNVHLSRLELGQENVSIGTLEKLAKEMRIELYKFFIKDSFKNEN